MKESEGKAMKKDIKCLQSVIQRRIDNLPSMYDGLYIEGSRDAYELVLQDIGQLDDTEVTLDKAFGKVAESYAMTKEDVCRHLEQIHAYGGKVTYGEPEVLSQEWISDHIIFNEKEDAEYIYADKLQNLLVSKKELPVIPKYVADWITKHRDTFDLYPMLKRLEKNSSRRELTYKWYRTNTHKFVNAYLKGEYEVEEEQKYYVINNEKYFLLAKDKAHGFVFSTGGNSRLGGPKNISAIFELTEQEIKDYDERYWAFAKPVEEMEE